MIGDLFSKLQEARKKIDEAKSKLNDIVLETVSENGHITVKANANKMIIYIAIDPAYKDSASTEELEATLLKTINNALEEAARQGEIEMKKITKDVLPSFPGLV
jgi:DNA-binding protein YbaB